MTALYWVIELSENNLLDLKSGSNQQYQFPISLDLLKASCFKQHILSPDIPVRPALVAPPEEHSAPRRPLVPPTFPDKVAPPNDYPTRTQVSAVRSFTFIVHEYAALVVMAWFEPQTAYIMALRSQWLSARISSCTNVIKVTAHFNIYLNNYLYIY